MTGPAHSVETSYEPHRNLITGVVNRSRVAAEVGGRKSEVGRDAGAPGTSAPSADSGPSTKHQGPRTLSSYLYANDLLGRRETISQGGEAFGMLALGGNRVEVAYNDRSEVVGAVTRRGDIPVARHTYACDAIGNRQRSASEVGTRAAGRRSESESNRKSEVSYEANALNQYATIDERNSSNPKSAIRNPQFDLDGNLIEDARHRYTWNADNNLVRVESKDGTSRIDYVYDHQSRRTVRIETRQPGTKNEEQRTTYYLYDAWNLLAEIDTVPSGDELGTLNFEPATLFSWGRDLSGSLQGAGGVGGLLAISKVNPDEGKPGGAQIETLNLKLETLFPTYDANGNIGQLIDNDGAIVAAYAYDPFGNVTEMAGAEAAENPWRFSTKPVEAGTGWLYYGFRWYDAEMGRWLSRDPIEEEGGLNLYEFCSNNVIVNTDVLGMLEGNEKFKIIIGPHGTGERGLPVRSGGSNGVKAWTWLSATPITSREEIVRRINQAKETYSQNNNGIVCPWNNYEIFMHGAESPLTLLTLQQEISSGADHYFLLLHGSLWGDSPLVEPGGKSNINGVFRGYYYTLKNIVNDTPSDAGPISFQCCHSSGVDMKDLTRPVWIPTLSNATVLTGNFLLHIEQAVEAVCCKAVENDY